MRYTRILLTILLASAIHPIGAQEHFISLSGEVGEHSWMTKSSHLDPNSSFGIGGGLGFNYELQQQHFLFSIGLAANASYSAFSLLPYSTSFRAYDSEGEQMNYAYYFTKRSDDYSAVSVQMPIMLGAQFGRVYFLAGAKLDARVWGQAKAKALARSDGNYVRYIDYFVDMPEHAFFENYQASSVALSSMGFNVLASAEVGAYLGDVSGKKRYSVRKRADVRYRLALYADYGLLNAYANGDARLYTTPTTFNEADMQSGIRLVNILASAERTAPVLPLQIGVKFTMLFHLPKKPVCVICR